MSDRRSRDRQRERKGSVVPTGRRFARRARPPIAEYPGIVAQEAAVSVFPIDPRFGIDFLTGIFVFSPAHAKVSPHAFATCPR